ncbi:hypothetical protein BDD12DRAFT_807563 [Trichophaea hybrida]|nr:hypothetical protein BDD12DRAFT_807563 [Trichophaea hybrida]
MSHKGLCLTSSIHSHGTISESVGLKYWKCSYCSMKYKLSGGTTKQAGHLQKHHSTQLNLIVPTSSAIVSGLINAAKQLDRQKFNQKGADDLFLRWIIHANVPFSMTSNSRF